MILLPANHTPVVKINHGLDLTPKPGTQIQLSAKGTYDPDGDELFYSWWQYQETDTYKGIIEIKNSENQMASLKIPEDVQPGESIHVICQVTDNGEPSLTRYQRIIIKVKP